MDGDGEGLPMSRIGNDGTIRQVYGAALALGGGSIDDKHWKLHYYGKGSSPLYVYIYTN